MNEFTTSRQSSPRSVLITVLSEATLLRTAWAVLRGDDVVVLETAPSTVILRPFVNAVSALLARASRLRYFEQLYDADGCFIREEWCVPFPDFFTRVEPVIERRLAFETLDERLGEMAMPSKHIVCKQAYVDIKNAARLRALEDEFSGRDCRIEGVNPAVLEAFTTYFRRPPAFPARPAKAASRALNALSLLSAAVGGIAFALAHARPTVAPSRAYRLIADTSIFDWRQIQLLEGIIDRPSELLLVFRNHEELATARRDWSEIHKYDLTLQSSGLLPITELYNRLIKMFGALATLARAAFDFPNDIFREMAKIPPKALVFRAFAETHAADAFFAKDDYNFDHLLRTAALRKRGILAAGINHGLPTPNIIEAGWRYIDFDLYFVFGAAIARNYLHTWSSRMTVCPVGIFAVSAEQFHAAKRARDCDFAVFYTALPEARAWLAQICDLARRYPDQRFYLKHKRSNPDRVRSIADIAGEPFPPNIIETGEQAYELILKTRFTIVSRNTTVAAEAIALNAITYVLDVTPPESVSYYKQFDGLVQADAAAIADEIDAIRAGRRRFDRERYVDLVALPGRPIGEVIRDELAKAAAGGLRVAAE